MTYPNALVKKAYELAKETLNNSYCPYSHFQVSACVKIKDQDQYVCGVNVENVSLGATICAERSAIVSLISQYGWQTEIEFLLLCTQPSTVPCCLCRQVLTEFCPSHMPVYISSPEKGIERCYALKELTPFSFDREEYQRLKATTNP